MLKVKFPSIIKIFVLITISLSIFYHVGKYNGFKDNEKLTITYVDYLSVCSWKIDLIGCIEYLKEAENMTFDFERKK